MGGVVGAITCIVGACVGTDGVIGTDDIMVGADDGTARDIGGVVGDSVTGAEDCIVDTNHGIAVAGDEIIGADDGVVGLDDCLLGGIAPIGKLGCLTPNGVKFTDMFDCLNCLD